MNQNTRNHLDFLFNSLYEFWKMDDLDMVQLYHVEIDGFVRALYYSNIINYDEWKVYTIESFRVFITQ